MNCLLESPPNIIIFRCFFDHLQTLENVDDVVDPSPLDLQLDRHLVKFQHDAVSSFKILDELFAELLKALLLAIVVEYLLFEHLLPGELKHPVVFLCAADDKDRLFVGNEGIDEVSMMIVEGCLRGGGREGRI